MFSAMEAVKALVGVCCGVIARPLGKRLADTEKSLGPVAGPRLVEAVPLDADLGSSLSHRSFSSLIRIVAEACALLSSGFAACRSVFVAERCNWAPGTAVSRYPGTNWMPIHRKM